MEINKINKDFGCFFGKKKHSKQKKKTVFGWFFSQEDSPHKKDPLKETRRHLDRTFHRDVHRHMSLLLHRDVHMVVLGNLMAKKRFMD